MPLDLVQDDEGSPGAGSASPKPITFEIVVNGKKEAFDLSNPEHLDTIRQRAQMGTNYSQRAEALNAKEIQLQKDYRPYMEFDRVLREDPALEALVTARLRGDPLPLERFGVRPASKGAQNGDEEDDTIDVAAVETRLRQEGKARSDRVLSAIEHLGSRMDQRDRLDAERADESRIKNHPVFKGHVSENHLALAKEAMRSRGGGLYDNFVLLFEHEIPSIVARRERDAIPPELRRTLLNQSSAPLVVDGLTLTEETLADIRSDPDKYAKYKKVLRAEKRRRSGLQEMPR